MDQLRVKKKQVNIKTSVTGNQFSSGIHIRTIKRSVYEKIPEFGNNHDHYCSASNIVSDVSPSSGN